ncbi:MAG: spondin domain-containing protein [Cyclobacteriaceae bacterium]
MKKHLFTPLLALGMLACNDDDNGTIVDPVEPASFRVTVANVATEYPIFQSGIFNTPDGTSDAGPATPGQAYTFSFYATPGMNLSLASMLVQTNDVFIAQDDDSGIPLFDGTGIPLEGDITSMFTFWDAGTEVNEEPGNGPNQAPRQSGPDTGTDEGEMVILLSDVNDGYSYPAIEDVVKITLDVSDNDSNLFTLTISNISGSSSLPGPISPGAYAVHTNAVQLFENNQTASDGIEDIAEDGDPSVLGTFATDNTGLVTPFSPGVYLVHSDGSMPLFTEGMNDTGDGLENIAEDGDPSSLAVVLGSNGDVSSSGVFNTPESASTPGPIFPGQSYSFTIEGSPGDQFNLATMLIQSNDLFIAFEDGGLPLFNGTDAVNGDVTSGLRIWDTGTEANEFPGAGQNQAPRQSGTNVGESETEPISEVNDAFAYPAVSDIIQVTIEEI